MLLPGDKEILLLLLILLAGGASGLTGKLEKLMNENSQLQKEIDELKSMQEAQQRHESGIGAAILHDKLESQERKIAVLELASKVTINFLINFI